MHNRSWQVTRIAILLLYLVGSQEVQRAIAQDPSFWQEARKAEAEVAQVLNPVSGKELAKAKRKALSSSPQDLAKEMLQVARAENEARRLEFLAGRGTLDIYLASSRRILQAELAVKAEKADRIESLQRCWERCKEAEEVNKERSERGRISYKEYRETEAERLAIEIQLWPIKPRVDAHQSWARESADRPDQIRTKELAKSQLEAMNASRQDLVNARFEALTVSFESRMKNCLAGRCTLDVLLAASIRLLDAELAMIENQSEQLIAFERHWERSKQIDEMERVRYDAGRVPFQDPAQARYYFLQAEIWLAQAKTKQKPAIMVGRTFGAMNPPEFGPSYFRMIAAAKYDATNADVVHLAKEKIEFAKAELAWRLKEFLNGRGTQDILLEVAHNYLESRLALAEPDDFVPLHERHWTLMMHIELIDKLRYDAQRIPIQDYLQAKCFRLQAQINWLKARGN